MKKRYKLIMALTWLVVLVSNAQVNIGGTPFSWSLAAKDSIQIPYITMPAINWQAVNTEDEQEQKQELFTVTLYPNPTTGMVTVTLSRAANAQIWVTNSFGQFVLKQGCNAQACSLDVSAFCSGIYSVTIFAEDNSAITKRLIVYK